MSDPHVTRDAIEHLTRELRRRYDALDRGSQSILRRCTTAGELCGEGLFWRLMDDAGVPSDYRSRLALAHVVVCFDAAEAGSEEFASWLRRTAYSKVKPADLPARAVRFRRLLAARDRDELVHQLRRLLKHGFQASKRGVAWDELGAGIFFWGGATRSRWAEQFFTQSKAATPNVSEANHV